jgi:AraC-like DNA-binding protein
MNKRDHGCCSLLRPLGRWRIQVAMRKLRATGASPAEVAVAVGYESEAAFSRAFKKVVGVAPGSWRRGQAAA